MRALLLRAWLRPLLVGLSLWLGIFGGSWATMHWLSGSIQSNIETAGALDFRIEQARQTLARIEEGTWGITLREIEGERFVVLPTGSLDRPPWTVRGRPAVEAVERVRDLYDRVGTAVHGGLEEVVRAVREGTAAALRASRNLAEASRAAQRADDALGRVLQDARREVARPLDLTRRRGGDRDHGPSR